MATKTLGGRKLGVTGSHKRAMLRNMAASLFLHEKVQTSRAKAKELRPYAEKIISQAKAGKHFLVRRSVSNKAVYKKLFEILAPRYAQRPGGYCRINHLAPRPGDQARRSLISLLS